MCFRQPAKTASLNLRPFIAATSQVFVILSFATLTLQPMPVAAWDSVVQIDGETIPAEYFDGYQEFLVTESTGCPAPAKNQVRDMVSLAWAKVKLAKEKGFQLTEKQLSSLADIKAKFEQDDNPKDEGDHNKNLWQVLRTQSLYYWAAELRKSTNAISEREIVAEYQRLVELGDARVVDVPFYKIMVMESNDTVFVDQLAQRLRSGELWRHISVDMNPYLWNTGQTERWVGFKQLAGYPANTFNDLNLKPKEIKRNDVIGPVELKDRVRLVVILDKTVEPIVPLNANLSGRKNWAVDQVKESVEHQLRLKLYESLLRDLNITENGIPISMDIDLPCVMKWQ